MIFKKQNSRFNILLFSLVFIMVSCQQKILQSEMRLKGNTYYINLSGDDNNTGNRESPWKTIQKLNSIQLKRGDSVLFESGQIFVGNIIIDSNESGTKENPIVIASSATVAAVIFAGNETALLVNSASYLTVRQLSFAGAGRKEGNTKDGVAVMNSDHVSLDHLTIEGFQKAGLLVFSSSDIIVKNVVAQRNGYAGISISGLQAKTDCHDILVSNCTAENNPGDPTKFDNHSGNGIVAGFCKNVTIEYCTATNNGWDMPRVGNGPVGIWCYEADSVIIQHCISYRNKTAAGAADGGGYDLDGGVTNSIIQYCLSYENQGSGFGIFQYAGASNWYNNTVRYCISENDGNVSAAHAGVFIWNSSRDDKQFKDLLFYNNIIYNDKGSAISYSSESENTGFRFYNNIFVGKDTLVTGKETSVTYRANNWWSLSGGFNIDGIKDLNTWAVQKGKEQMNNKVIGLNMNPKFTNQGNSTLTIPLALNSYVNYHLPSNSPLRTSGLDLKKVFGIDVGIMNINHLPILPTGIGAGN